jgi:signal transduction histidine kinase
LSFVSWIAKAHGGSVHVESELNRGSRFTVSLPTQPDEPAPERLAVQASGPASRA